jgi:hypothetical protein
MMTKTRENLFPGSFTQTAIFYAIGKEGEICKAEFILWKALAPWTDPV